MTDTNRHETLELYKHHSELADRVSQRREGANRLFVGVLTGLLVFLGAALRFGNDDLGGDAVFLAVGIAGVVLAAAWYIVIRSYRQLNTGKFLALHELEKELSYPFYTREWELLGEGRDVGRYWRLTVVETFLPAVFALLFIVLLIASL